MKRAQIPDGSRAKYADRRVYDAESTRQPSNVTIRERHPLMPDALGPRLKLGVIAPATNTVVQPEFDAMRPRGVTNQMMRVVIPDSPVGNDEEFATMMSGVRASIETGGRRS